MVDEARNLSLNALEELRLHNNLQIQGKPLLQIFLVNPEGLREKLADPEVGAVASRVTAAASDALTQERRRRTSCTGSGRWMEQFPGSKASVLPVIEAACQGVPRRINQFCGSRLLLHGAVEEKAVLGVERCQDRVPELSEERLSHVPVGLGSTSTPNSLTSRSTGRRNRTAMAPGLVFANAEERLREQKKKVMPGRTPQPRW